MTICFSYKQRICHRWWRNNSKENAQADWPLRYSQRNWKASHCQAPFLKSTILYLHILPSSIFRAPLINKSLPLCFCCRGAFSYVKRVTQKLGKMEYAAKFVSSRAKRKASALREMNLLSRLDHERIVYFHDAFEKKNAVIIITEMYPHFPVCQHISKFRAKSSPNISLDESIKMPRRAVGQICEEIHDNGVWRMLYILFRLPFFWKSVYLFNLKHDPIKAAVGTFACCDHQVRSCMRQLLEGMDYLHSQNIIHLDIKVFFTASHQSLPFCSISVLRVV